MRCWLRGHSWIGDRWRGWTCERCDKEPKVCRNCFGQHDPTAFRLLREELAKRTAELREERDEIARLAAELERWPTALTVDGTTGDAALKRSSWVGEL